MCGGGGDADRIEPGDRRGATDRTGHVRGACFELVRHLVPGTAVESDRADHVAAALPGLHRFEVFALRVQHAESGRDRQSVGEGKSVSVRVVIGGRRIIQKKKNAYKYQYTNKEIH